MPSARRVRALVLALTTAAVAWLGFPPNSPATLPWMSGVSHAGSAADTSLDDWRRHPPDISGTWNDTYEAQANQWSLMAQYGHGSWQGHVDNAIGGIYKSRGDTWSAAASGAYNERWRKVLTTTRQLWGDKPGTMYIRFAHEFNGDWYDWSVKKSEIADFKKAWIQFRNVQQETFPGAKLVFSPNSETLDAFGADWRTSFPGAAHVDVIGVDYYNQYPFISSSAQFKTVAMLMDEYGGPRGLERHRRFAASVGLPMSLPEWSSNGGMGDSAAFVAGLHAWLTKHAGTGAGDLLYEIQFSVPGYNSDFIFFPGTKQPLAAAKYRELWRIGN